MTHFGLVVRGLTRKKLRTLFTVASLAATLFGLTLLFSLVWAIQNSGRKSTVPRVITHSASSLAVNLIYPMRQKLESMDGVAAVTPYSWFGGIYKDRRNFFAQFATDPRNVWDLFPDVWEISEAQKQAFIQTRTGAVAGEGLIAKYGWKLGDKISLQSPIYGISPELTLVGIMKGKDPDQPSTVMYFQHDYWQELRGNPGDVGSFWLRLKNPADVPRVMRAVDQMFYNSDHETKTETEKAFQLQFVSMLGNIQSLAIFVGTLAVVSILLIVGNTMAMAVRERTSEVAVLKTLGFTASQVLALVLGESMAIACLGGGLGILAALAMTPALRAAGQFAPFLQGYKPALPIFVLAAGLTLGIGLLAGAIPAWNSSRLRVVEGLRKVV